MTGDRSPAGSDGSRSSAPPDDGRPPSRRSVLRGIGAAVAATGVPTELDGRDRAIATTAGSDVAGSAAPRQSGVDPIPEAYEITVDGVKYEVPVHRKTVTGTCEDLTDFVSGLGVLPPQLTPDDFGGLPVGITYGQWTVNGTEVWPIAAPVIERINPGALSDDLENPDAAVPRLDAPVGDALEIEERTVDGQDVMQVVGNDVSFGANVEVNVVDWHPSYPVSDSCRDYWCELITHTVGHERVHATDALEVAAVMNGKLDGTLDPPEVDDLPEEGVPDLPLSVSYGPTSRSRAEAERRLREQFRRLLYYYVEEATSRFFGRGREFHEQETDERSDRTCSDSCQNCDDVQQPPLGAFESWRMDVSYVLDIRVTPQDATETGYSHLYRTYDASFELTRTSGGPLDGASSTIRSIFSWLNGIDEFLGDLLGLVGVDVDLVPDDAAARTDGNYSGTGEVTVRNHRRTYVEGDDGEWWTMSTSADETVSSSAAATLDVSGEVGEYTFDIPAPGPISGRRRTRTSSGNSSEASVEITMGTPMRALVEVGADGVEIPSGGGDGPPDVSNRTVGNVPDAGDVPTPGSREATFPIEDCQRLLSGSVENDLWGVFPNVQRAFMRQEGEGSPDGRESLYWQIVPVESPDGPGHLTCPSGGDYSSPPDGDDSDGDGPADETGSGEVQIAVGARANGGYFGFDPAAVRVSTGTTVTWEWTGRGGEHDVVHEGGEFESELTDEPGHTFSHTFESAGTYEYFCTTHREQGMTGTVVVEE